MDIRVFRHDDLGGKFIVGSDGTVILQFVGSVTLSGMTPEQATQKVTALLADGWLRKPQVSVNIAEFGKNSSPSKGPSTAAAASPWPATTLHRLPGHRHGRRLQHPRQPQSRHAQTRPKSYTINVKEIEKDPSLDIPLKDGDVLTVRESAL